MARRRARKQLPGPLNLTIDAMSHEGRGIAHLEGKTIFVFGALLGETVRVQIKKTSRRFDEAVTLEVLNPSAQRIVPKCDFFEVCGGCSLQHMSNEDQVALKQNSLLEMMAHAGLEAAEVLPALRTNPWGYRRKARLGVKFVRKKDRVLVGFRERNKPYLADMTSCEVLIPRVGHRLQELIDLIETLDAKQTIPQIEVAADEQHVVLVFRHIEPLSDDDLRRLTDFAKDSGFWLQLQSGGPESIVNLYPERQILHFSPQGDGRFQIDFGAADFIQVNSDINQQMVALALEHLNLKKTDKVLDLFCGLGNFTLPMAQLCAQVTGVEGDQAMVNRGSQNALEHKITNSDYIVADLTKPDIDADWMRSKYDKILIDPPRSGAMEIAGIIKRFKSSTIVYISCQPSSLVRDSQLICNQGYKLSHLGIMDMFPQTAHVESIAVFKRK